jgi:H+/gluconate symporter-like permease
LSFLVAIAALVFLMVAAYRGHSVILFAPIAAMGAVLLTDPSAVAPVFTGLFMERMAGFVKLYFPVFLLGAIFGKLIEVSGFARAIVASSVAILGRDRAMLAIVFVAAILTYGGVSLFVVVFAVYPFAAELFRRSNIPKRLIPATIALGAFTFTMDSLPGTPQIQNIIQNDDLGGADTRHDRSDFHSGARPRVSELASPRGIGERRGLRRKSFERTGG